VVLRSEQGESSEVYLHGAHVVTWKTADGKDLLFTSKQAIFKPPKAIRGGVPVCFPQFGQLGPLGQHGFARNSMFKVTAGTSNSVTLSLSASGAEDAKYPHPFELQVKVELGPGTFTQELEVLNSGSSPMSFTCALHTYFAVPSISEVQVLGLEGTTYTDSLAGGAKVVQEGPVVFDKEVDRIYVAAPHVIKIKSGSSTLEVHKVNFPDAVVWNPWIDKSKSMGDFGDEEYKEMLCIEPSVAGSGPVVLEPGKTWSAQQKLVASS